MRIRISNLAMLKYCESSVAFDEQIAEESMMIVDFLQLNRTIVFLCLFRQIKYLVLGFFLGKLRFVFAFAIWDLYDGNALMIILICHHSLCRSRC